MTTRNHVSPETLRRVWQEVTYTPGAKVDTLAARVGISHVHAHAALSALRDMGYVQYADRETGAREVIVWYGQIGGQR